MTKALVVITGASSGIGRSTAKAFATEGHPFLLIARHIEPLPELSSHPVIYEKADVANYDVITHAVQKTETWNPINWLKSFCTAGNCRPIFAFEIWL